jgi:alpha-D-xyloside xylohydrolase
VHLPAGARWTDAWADEDVEGGPTVTAAALIDRIPLFLRDGARLPIREQV